jgi:hypothetical protein
MIYRKKRIRMINSYADWVNETSSSPEDFRQVMMDAFEQAGIKLKDLSTSREKSNGTLRILIPCDLNPELVNETLNEWGLKDKVDLNKQPFNTNIDSVSGGKYLDKVFYLKNAVGDYVWALTIYRRGAVRTHNASSDLFKFTPGIEGAEYTVNRLKEYTKAQIASVIGNNLLDPSKIDKKVPGKGGDFDPELLSDTYDDKSIEVLKKLRRDDPGIYQVAVKYLIYMGYISLNIDNNPKGKKISFYPANNSTHLNLKIEANGEYTTLLGITIYRKIQVGRTRKEVTKQLDVTCYPHEYEQGQKPPITNSVDRMVWDKLKKSPKNYVSPTELYSPKKTALAATRLGLL